MQRSAAPSQIRKKNVAANASKHCSDNERQETASNSNSTTGSTLTFAAKSHDASSLSTPLQQRPQPYSRQSLNSRPFRPFKSPMATTKPIPFKPPTQLSASSAAEADSKYATSSIPLKEAAPVMKSGMNKRNAESTEVVITKQLKVAGPTLSGSASSVVTAPKLRSSITFKPPSSNTETAATRNVEEKCFNVLWRKKTGKKHKTWDGDGILVVNGSSGILKDMNGKDISKGNNIIGSGDLKSGDELSFGGKDLESVIDKDVRTDIYLAASRPAVLRTKFKMHTAMTDNVETVYTPPQPRHKPDAPHAILLPRPSSSHPRVAKGYGSKRPPGDVGLLDVVIDPILGQHLRPHQKEGVRFLYECVMQMKNINGQGAILADEMGLGKTLQTIALLWTLIKQSPYYGEETCVVKKALVVCPASLILNWEKEFRKWLGNERLRVFAVDSKSTMTDFTLGKVYPVMIIGYEKLRIVQDELKSANFDIIVCDEGHRLKAANIKTAQAIRSLSTKRRIILSGTPIQNDLGEFFAMIDFVNPGLLDSYSTFKKVFEDPIVRSRQPDCSAYEAALGLERSQELTRLTGQFILRRTAQVNYEFLPPKSELVVFCQPSPLQRAIYRHIIESPFLQSCFSMDSSRHLSCITALRKLCNSPRLVLDHTEAEDSLDIMGLYTGVKSLVESSDNDMDCPSIGGKLSFVDSFLRSLRENTSERVVLVSNFTQTLDILEAICVRYQYGFFRLDGSTPTHKRQEYVDKFNAPSCRKCRVMFDIDWSGTIEEKMYQRQLTKIGLSNALMDGKTTEKLNKFSIAELRDLFTFHDEEHCQTHSLLGCECNSTSASTSPDVMVIQSTVRSSNKRDEVGIMNKSSATLARKELQEWTHIDVQAWKTLRPKHGRTGHEKDGDSTISTIAAKDKILWKVICEEAKDENQHLSDRDVESAETSQNLDGAPNGVVSIENSPRSSAVGFVFFKFSNQ
ncbi:helicase [Haplosporangium sp. Z 11]|nr:helicase [Haplosporangium sp. Z 11]